MPHLGGKNKTLVQLGGGNLWTLTTYPAVAVFATHNWLRIYAHIQPHNAAAAAAADAAMVVAVVEALKNMRSPMPGLLLVLVVGCSFVASPPHT